MAITFDPFGRFGRYLVIEKEEIKAHNGLKDQKLLPFKVGKMFF
jgi:hypothetical protein